MAKHFHHIQFALPNFCFSWVKLWIGQTATNGYYRWINDYETQAQTMEYDINTYGAFIFYPYIKYQPLDILGSFLCDIIADNTSQGTQCCFFLLSFPTPPLLINMINMLYII